MLRATPLCVLFLIACGPPSGPMDAGTDGGGSGGTDGGSDGGRDAVKVYDDGGTTAVGAVGLDELHAAAEVTRPTRTSAENSFMGVVLLRVIREISDRG